MNNLANRLSPFAKWLLLTWALRAGTCEGCGQGRILRASTGLCGRCTGIPRVRVSQQQVWDRS